MSRVNKLLSLGQLISIMTIFGTSLCGNKVTLYTDYKYTDYKEHSIECSLWDDIFPSTAGSSGTREKFPSDFDYFKRLLYLACAISVVAFLGIIWLSFVTACRRKRCTKFEFVFYEILVLFWIPLTIGLTWSLTVGWSEDKDLRHYGRPSNWCAATAFSLCLSCFLLLDIILVVLARLSHFTEKSDPEIRQTTDGELIQPTTNAVVKTAENKKLNIPNDEDDI